MPQDPPANARRRTAVGCVAFFLLFVGFLVFAIWIAGEPNRNARRFRSGVLPGMTLLEVVPLVVGQGRWVILASPRVAGSGDAISVANVSNGAVHYKRGATEHYHRSGAEFLESIRAEEKSMSGDWHWSFTFFGMTPGRATVTVEFDAEGHVEQASEPRMWD